MNGINVNLYANLHYAGLVDKADISNEIGFVSPSRGYEIGVGL